MNSQRLRLPVYEVNPSMRVDSLRGKRDTTRKDGGAVFPRPLGCAEVAA